MIGNRYGRLFVIDKAEPHISKSGRAYTAWLCRCDCGNTVVVIGDNLKRNKTHSCGCYQKEFLSCRMKTHGESEYRLYGIWEQMRNRCYRKSVLHYSDYGGRGIIVCDEWKNSYESFRDWALVNGYQDNLSIDRINNDGNYEPDNCRWVSAAQQANNRRSNRLITYNGETHNVSEWAKILNKNPKSLYSRIYAGWDLEKVLTT